MTFSGIVNLQTPSRMKPIKADFTLVGDIDIGLSWSPPIRLRSGPGDFNAPCPVMEPTGLSCQGVTAEVIAKVCLADLEPFIPKYIH